MYGVVITSRPNLQVAETIEHVDGLPTRRAADDFAHKWCKEAPNNRTAFVYEMEQPAQKEPPLFTYSTGPAGATLNLTPQQLLDKVDTLCTKLDTLKRFICDDPTITSLLVEEVTLAHHLAHELWDALPDVESDDGAVGEAIKKAYGDETENG